MGASSPPLAQATCSRDGYIDTWDEYWLEMAATASRKSKDERCAVGAVVVKDNMLLSTGFNGLPRNVFDDRRLLDDVEEKLKVICHAEQNAIYNAARVGRSLQEATIYVTKFPCLACCNAVIQAGIRVIHTHDTKYWNDDPFDADHTRKQAFLRQAKIKVEAPFHPQFAPKRVVTAASPTRGQLPLTWDAEMAPAAARISVRPTPANAGRRSKRAETKKANRR